MGQYCQWLASGHWQVLCRLARLLLLQLPTVPDLQVPYELNHLLLLLLLSVLQLRLPGLIPSLLLRTFSWFPVNFSC